MRRAPRVGMVAGCSSSSDDASDETGGEETSQVLPPVIVETWVNRGYRNSR